MRSRWDSSNCNFKLLVLWLAVELTMPCPLRQRSKTTAALSVLPSRCLSVASGRVGCEKQVGRGCGEGKDSDGLLIPRSDETTGCTPQQTKARPPTNHVITSRR